MSVEYGLSAYYGNAYLLQAAQYVWHASIAEKRSYPLPEFELKATLFAAFAAEAYINTALALMIGRDDAKALQRGPVPERWLVGPRLIAGRSVLEKGREPHQTLVALFKERNRLSHARAIRLGFRAWDEEERSHDDLATVARYILRVSEAAFELSRLAPELEPLSLVPSGLRRLDVQLASYDSDRHAEGLQRTVRQLRVALAQEEFGTASEWVDDWGEDPETAWWTREEDIDEQLPDA